VGIVILVAGALLGLGLLLYGVDRRWRIALYIPFWLGSLGVHQAREKTCVLLAARGMREANGDLEPVDDDEERQTLRRQARLVYIQTTAAAVLPTALGLILP
jgi:hypothetical protein